MSKAPWSLPLFVITLVACGEPVQDAPDATPDAPHSAIDAANVDGNTPAPDAGIQPGAWPMPGGNPGATRKSPVDGPSVSASSAVTEVVAVSGPMIDTGVEPVLCGGRLYVAHRRTDGGRVTAFDAAGAMIWDRDLPDEVIGLVCGPGGALFVLAQTRIELGTDVTAMLHGLAADGSDTWSFPFSTPATAYRIGGAPDGSAIIVGDNSITKVSAAGEMVWHRAFGASRIAAWAVASDGGVRLAFANGTYVKSLTPSGADDWVYTDTVSPLATHSARVAIGDGDNTIVAIVALESGSGWRARKLLLDATGHATWAKAINVPTNLYYEAVASLSVDGLASCAQILEHDSANPTYRQYCADDASASPYAVGATQAIVDPRGHRYAVASGAVFERNADHSAAGMRTLPRSYDWVIPDAAGSLLLVGPTSIVRVSN